MTDILTHDDVREGLALSKGISPEHAINADKFQRLCRDYLTLRDLAEESASTIGRQAARIEELDNIAHRVYQNKDVLERIAELKKGVE